MSFTTVKNPGKVFLDGAIVEKGKNPYIADVEIQKVKSQVQVLIRDQGKNITVQKNLIDVSYCELNSNDGCIVFCFDDDTELESHFEIRVDDPKPLDTYSSSMDKTFSITNSQEMQDFSVKEGHHGFARLLVDQIKFLLDS